MPSSRLARNVACLNVACFGFEQELGIDHSKKTPRKTFVSDHDVPAEEPVGKLSADSLSTGVTFMMMLAVAQRGVGFLRTAIFCRLLPEQELGQWSLVFSFVMLSAPMTLMGITGSFGRYVEHYFQKGLVKQFFRRTGAAVTLLTATVLACIWLLQDQVAWALFGSAAQKHLLLPACLTLLTNIVYNYFLESAIALRRIRVGSLMELISSWTFAVVAVVSLFVTDLGAFGVILGFAAGNLAGAVFSGFSLSKVWSGLPSKKQSFPHVQLWQKLAPFALGLWIVNIVTNLFDLSDRYMIVHFSGMEPEVAQGMVGQYFSSLAVPLLMVGLSSTLAHLVMPYLSQDWEQGNVSEVSARVNLSIKMLGFVLCMASAGVLCLAPLLFNVAFGGKYDAGFAVLPYAVAFCFWRAIVLMGYNYLYCVEKTRMMCFSLLAALIINILLNAILLPRFGLTGAALATTISSVLNLTIILTIAIRLGFQWSRGVLWVFLFPLVLPAGPLATSGAFALLCLLACRSNAFFSETEKQQLDEVIRGLLGRVLPEKWVLRIPHSLAS